MKKKNDYFKTFCKVSKALGTTLDNKELIDLIVSSAIETMGAKAACLFLADEGKDIFVPVAQKGLSKKYLHANPLKAKTIVAAIQKKGFLHFRDATTDPRLEHHEAKKAEGIATLLSVAVVVRKRTIGILSLYMAKPKDFTEEEIEFMSAMAEQGGMAIENNRLIDQVRHNAKLFLDMAASINSSLEIKEILHKLTADLAESLEMKGVAIRLLDKEHEIFKLVASHGLSESFLDKGPVSAAKCLAHALKGETQVIEDVATSKEIQYRKETLEEGIVSMLCVPIRSKDDIIGVLRLYSGVKRDFPEDTIMLVNALAHQGGLAIQNASMLMMLQEDKTSLEKEIWSHRMWF